MTSRFVGYLRREPAVITVYAALAVVLVVWLITVPSISILSLTVSLSQKLPLAIATIGAAIVIMGKGIDLSVGAVITVMNVIVAAGGQGSITWILVGFAVAIATGLVNGVAVAYVGLPPLVVTLATQSILLGMALYILPTPGGSVDLWLTDVPLLLLGPVPLALVLMVAIPLATWYPLQATRYGPALLATGADRVSAYNSGIRTKPVVLSTYVISACFAALAGVFITMNTGTGDPVIAVSYTMNTIAAAVVGGVILRGGRGTIAGAVAGALLISFINNLLFAMGVNTYWQYVVTGTILIVAISVPLLARSRKAAR